MKEPKAIHQKTISLILYIIGALTILIPVLVAYATSSNFSSLFTKVLLTIGIGLIEIGILLKAVNNHSENKPVAKEIGLMLGLILALIIQYIH